MLGFMNEGLEGVRQYPGVHFRVLLNWILNPGCMSSLRKYLCCFGESLQTCFALPEMKSSDTWVSVQPH
jgi:hypothetical protein